MARPKAAGPADLVLFESPGRGVVDQHVLAAYPDSPWVRYMDDMLAFADDKPTLWRIAAEVRDVAREALGLRLKERATVVAPVTEGFPWLGFRVWPGLIRIQKEGRRRFGRKLGASIRRASREPSGKDDEVGRAASLCGHLQQADTTRLGRSMLRRLDDGAVVE
ncbi:MAG: hypothetical protein ACQEXJ_20765 [Myxococcota bacterium]